MRSHISIFAHTFSAFRYAYERYVQLQILQPQYTKTRYKHPKGQNVSRLGELLVF